MTKAIDYVENEEFSDNEAKFYNEQIKKFEDGNLENVAKLRLSQLEKRISALEKDIHNGM